MLLWSRPITVGNISAPFGGAMKCDARNIVGVLCNPIPATGRGDLMPAPDSLSFPPLVRHCFATCVGLSRARSAAGTVLVALLHLSACGGSATSPVTPSVL